MKGKKIMKKHILFVLAIMAAVLSMTSCLGDDYTENTTTDLTDAQRQAQLESLAGTYNGSIYCYNPYYQTMIDTLDCSWTISDTTLVVSLPKKLAAELTTNIITKYTTKDETTVEQKYTLYPYYNESDNVYTYYMWPRVDEFSFKTDVNDKETDVTMTYGTYFQYYTISGYTYYYPVCEYAPSNKQFVGNVIFYSISFDGVLDKESRILVLNGVKE